MTVMSIEQLKDIIPDPRLTVEELSKYVIGQDNAKHALALMMFNRAIVMLQAQKKIQTSVDVQKYNTLLIGPSGTGKTALIKALSKVFGLPILIFDVTGLTASGYIGNKVEDVLHKHIDLQYKYFRENIEDLFNSNEYMPNFDFTEMSAKKDDILKSMINYGIIYLDEVDKIKSRPVSDKSDINGDMVQNELLKLLEGQTVLLDSGHMIKNELRMDSVKTHNLFFIGGGVFSGLDDIIKDRLKQDSGIGFTGKIQNVSKSNLWSKITTEDLISYGFKREFVGRIPLKTQLGELDEKAIVQIIKEPVNSIYKQYIDIFKIFNIEVTIDNAACEEITKKVVDLKMGARALQPVFHKLFSDYLFNIFDMKEKNLHISKKIVQDNCNEI